MITALFVCVHDAGRRQVAAAVFNTLTEGQGHRSADDALDFLTDH